MPGLESLFKNTSQDETKKGICILIKFETGTGNRYQKSWEKSIIKLLILVNRAVHLARMFIS